MYAVLVYSLNGMSKKKSERISYGQYRLTDLFIFLLIMCVFEMVNVFAIKEWFTGQLFIVSVMLLVTLVVMVRWGWFGAIFPLVDGAVYCWANGATAEQFGIYILGNAFVALVLLLFLVVPKEKLIGRWYLTVLYAAVAYVCLVLGRATLAAIFGHDFLSSLLQYLSVELLNLGFAVLGLLILRRLDGMLVDQKKYLLHVSEEQSEVKPPDEERWNGYTELDDDELRALAAMDDYDRKVKYNAHSLDGLKAKENVPADDTKGESEHEDKDGGD